MGCFEAGCDNVWARYLSLPADLGQAFGSITTGKGRKNKLSALRESKGKIRGKEGKGGGRGQQVCQEDFDATCFFGCVLMSLWLLLLDGV